MTKVTEFIHKTMDEMERQGFTEEEARTIVRLLGREIKENSRRREMAKPFTVFKG